MAGDQNPLAGFPFDELPRELLLEIFKNAYPDNVYYGHRLRQRFVYPANLAQVCKYWRRLALEERSLWKNIYLMDSMYEYEMGAATRTYLERSKNLPLFLTWFSYRRRTRFGVIKKLITSCAARLQRITVFVCNRDVLGKLTTEMGSLSFPFLQDFEISYMGNRSLPSSFTLYLEAPHLRRCKLDRVPFFQLPMSNLVVFDYAMEVCETRGPVDLNPLLEFFPRVAHSLEHVRIKAHPTNVYVYTLNRPKIALQKLKSLIVQNSYIFMRHLLTPGLTYLKVSFSKSHLTNGKEVAEMFNDFSAPELRSIRFRRVPLLPLPASQNIPLMFPQLEFCAIVKCDMSAFLPLLEPLEQKESPFSQEVSERPQKTQQAENPFPKLKELMIVGETSLTALQATIDKRIENGGKSLQKIYLECWDFPRPPGRRHTRATAQHLGQQGIDLQVLNCGDKLPETMTTPLAFQDHFFKDERGFFNDILESEYSFQKD